MSRKALLFIAAAGMLLMSWSVLAAESVLRPEMEAFIAHMQTKHGYDSEIGRAHV